MWFSLNLLNLTIQFVGAGSQASQVFDLRYLSYLEHCSNCRIQKLKVRAAFKSFEEAISSRKVTSHKLNTVVRDRCLLVSFKFGVSSHLRITLMFKHPKR